MQEFNFSFTQKELWLIIKSLGRLNQEDSQLLVDKITDIYTIQRLGISQSSPE